MRGLLLLLPFLIIGLSAVPLPFCPDGDDSFGSWVSTEHYENSSVFRSHVEDRFLFGGPGSAVNFSNIWVPDSCAYHRFTNTSLLKLLEHEQQTTNSTDPIRIVFLGDSATRGVLCGIARIMVGSELLGPCVSDICGTPTKLAASVPETHLLFNLTFGGRLQLDFMYIQSLSVAYTRLMVNKSVEKKPYALLLNTGAWDFREYNTAHLGVKAKEFCDSPELEALSQSRVDPYIQDMFSEVGNLAKKLGVRVIYRTNHHNARFGTHCADDLLLPVVRQASWEVWDNRRISNEVWVHQEKDGFHFDRHSTHTVEDHLLVRREAERNHRPMPGMLEMQLAQSLLHTLFGDAVRGLIRQGVHWL